MDIEHDCLVGDPSRVTHPSHPVVVSAPSDHRVIVGADEQEVGLDPNFVVGGHFGDLIREEMASRTLLRECPGKELPHGVDTSAVTAREVEHDVIGENASQSGAVFGVDDAPIAGRDRLGGLDELQPLEARSDVVPHARRPYPLSLV